MEKDNKFTMTLNPTAEKMFKDTFFNLLEVEIIQGERKVLANGQAEYTLMLDDDKAEIIKTVMVGMINNGNTNGN